MLVLLRMNVDIGRLLNMAGWTPLETVVKFTSMCIHLHLKASFPYSNPESLLQSPNMMMDQRYHTQDSIAKYHSSSCPLYVFMLQEEEEEEEEKKKKKSRVSQLTNLTSSIGVWKGVS